MTAHNSIRRAFDIFGADVELSWLPSQSNGNGELPVSIFSPEMLLFSDGPGGVVSGLGSLSDGMPEISPVVISECCQVMMILRDEGWTSHRHLGHLPFTGLNYLGNRTTKEYSGH